MFDVSNWVTRLNRIDGPEGMPSHEALAVSPQGYYGQLNSSSLHKQTRRNPLGRDVCSLVENHDLWPSLQNICKSQAYSRVPECDGRPTVQVEPSPINRMINASAGMQTDLSKWFTPHIDLFATCLNHKIPLYISPVPDQNAWDLDALNINWLSVTAYHPSALAHRVIQKIRQCNFLIIVIAPGWSEMPWFWDLVQLSTAIPVTNTSQKVPQSSVLQQSSTSQPPRLVSRSEQLQDQGLSVEVAKRIAVP